MIDLESIWEKIIAENDQEAYSSFFDYFYPRLYRVCLEYVKIPSAAEDVVSDVIYNLLKNRKELKTINRIGPYLYTAVKNKSLSWIRDEKKMLTHDKIEEVEDYIIFEENEDINLPIDLDLKHIFDNTVKNLPKQRQLVFRLIREEGLLPEEVAELLNISVRTIEKHMQLTIRALCLLLKDHIKDQRHHTKVRKFFPRSFSLFIF